MLVEEFEKNLMIHGTDLNQWPEDLRFLALDFLSSSVAHQQAISREIFFENELRALIMEARDSRLEQRILAQLLPRKELGWSRFFQELFWGTSLRPAAFALVLLLGFFAGAHLTEKMETAPKQEDLSSYFYDFEGVYL